MYLNEATGVRGTRAFELVKKFGRDDKLALRLMKSIHKLQRALLSGDIDKASEIADRMYDRYRYKETRRGPVRMANKPFIVRKFAGNVYDVGLDIARDVGEYLDTGKNPGWIARRITRYMNEDGAEQIESYLVARTMYDVVLKELRKLMNIDGYETELGEKMASALYDVADLLVGFLRSNDYVTGVNWKSVWNRHLPELEAVADGRADEKKIRLLDAAIEEFAKGVIKTVAYLVGKVSKWDVGLHSLQKLNRVLGIVDKKIVPIVESA